MATAKVTTTPFKGCLRHVWEGLLEGEAGDAAETYNSRDRITASISGTFNTEMVTIEGSLDGTTWGALTTNGTDAAAVTAADVINIWEAPRYIRPTVTSGAGVDIDVIIECYGSGN